MAPLPAGITRKRLSIDYRAIYDAAAKLEARRVLAERMEAKKRRKK